MHQLNRTDVLLMVALENGKADNAAFGLTIEEIMECIEDNGNKKSRMTVYRRLKGLVEAGYISKGVLNNHADTFYLLNKGKAFLGKGDS
ncbi:MAG: hypothetical protein IKO36_02595 [Bacteroidaceae bacterium]|nr:hypothetical protein [Bacteroidaceae bacterium]